MEVRRQMNEEAMKWSEEQLQEGLTYGEVAFSFVEQTFGIVEDTMQIFRDKNEDEWDAVERSKLPKVEEELHYFFLFALVYWWQKSPSYTQEQKHILEKVLFHHIDIGLGDDAQGRAAWDTLQERFIAYGQTANDLEQKDYSAMLHDFAKKLSEHCGIGYLSSAILVPSLFTTALRTVSVLKADRRRSK